MSPVTRREILLGGGLLTLGGLGWGLHSRALRRRRDEALEAIAATQPDAGRLAAAGELYLAAYPDESDVDRLGGLILPDLGPLGWKRDTEMIRQALTTGIAEDFRTGDLVELAGWQYSRTEARFAARFALARRAEP